MTDSHINKNISSLNSALDFRKIIERECRRADRYNAKLSLIIYEIGSRNERDLAVRLFIRVMGRRVRNMDDIGWFDISQIGVLLPHTPGIGACRLSEDLSSLLSADPSALPFTIYSYPSHLWPVSNRLSLIHRLKLSVQDIFWPHHITSSADFRACLAIELERATRYGFIFSLLIFHVDKLPARCHPVGKVVKCLNRCLRDTDEIGWFGQDNIGVILPYASFEDCQEIARRVCRKAAISPVDTHTIYAYPRKWFPQEFTIKGLEVAPLRKRSVGQRSTEGLIELEGSGERRDTLPEAGVQFWDAGQIVANPLPGWKRGLDITISLIALLLCAPLFVFAALGIKLSSPGPIIFKQTRVGFVQRPFALLKFRSMCADADAESHRKLMKRIISQEDDRGETKLESDQRIFPFGLFLRKSSIDELPQLINILKGEMSLVGPRPCLPYEAEEYLHWHTRRFYTMPGLTGLWQVSGKNKLSFKQMIRLDISYEKRLSLILDIKILCRTIPAVMSIFFNSNE